MSNIDKQALRERYSLQPVPKCHICDAVMTIARASAGAVVYACSGCTYDDNGAHYAPGRSLGDDHYSASRVTIFESGDSDVLELLDELEAAENNLLDSECHVAELEESLRDKQALLEALDNALCELLPGTQYMDPPDGGSVTPLEQVRRMVADYLERISNLESRKVCVPRISNDEFWLNFNNRIVFREETYRSAVIKAIEDAGIGVKGE
ncbi:ead/Ea22-like family protein [Salmonella enterica subsp. enterica serovar Anatum]|uniref:Ead/Ea22-like family protein n=1 Tax=Salmonella anatum TaxID=58712 RepID=A0A4Z9PPH4_SALAN|nr:ead/Ea22-like family protein [Salmonella enterica]EDL5267272.1 ead/Ea22-like family protein [Salmonella enterica subsp. enterica serovar Enteritidis]EDW2027416.1 ead/Ea22-like family protein [Salmonella enterica subsp. enterica]MBW6637229.1 ead/Ea22-like family protein [Salmonella enterica subsp. enterica serovar Weltevreden]DAI78209.1 MAG TPA: Ead/Ea22-like protein [Caudoviricetes sp.]HCM6296352.1 ead/Ea22-like family protein [Salmonella enterica subsp. enterica serovar 3:e,h:1,6]